MAQTNADTADVSSPLDVWVNAITKAIPGLGAMLNINETEVSNDTLQLTESILGNYIYLYGDSHAYQIGIIASKTDCQRLTRDLVGADPEESIEDIDVYDGVGEILNILVGNVKTAVGHQYQNLAIGLPITIAGAIVYPPPEASTTKCVRLGSVRLGISVDMHPLPKEVRRQRELEQEARQREAWLKTVLDTAPDGIITVSASGTIKSVNKAAEQTFDSSSEAMVGKTLKNFLPDIPPNHESFLTDGGIRNETIGLRENQIRFPLEYACSDVHHSGQRHFVVVLRDISHRKDLEEELNNSRRLDAIGQLAAGIAHEINTPIQYVGDNTHFLEDSFTDILSLLDKYNQLKEDISKGLPLSEITDEINSMEEDLDIPFLKEDIPSAITQTLDGVSRVGDIVKAMKAFAHPGKEKAPVNINAALETTITVCRNEWKYASNLDTQFDETLPSVDCIGSEINQVFLNLIVNAAHAISEKVGESGDKGTITIRTVQKDNWVEVRIEDTGAGIPIDIQSKIFEPFFTTKEVGKGTGQGLSIAHNIIAKKHGGELLFESEANVGTTFIVRLPI